MFYHNQGIALVLKLAESVEQVGVVPRMQADGRLVEHVEHAAQVGAKLGSQANALALPAAERSGGTIELEVAQADLFHEMQALGDLGNDIASDECGLLFEFESADELLCFAD